MKIDSGGKTGRRPGSVSSRDAILNAARDQFTRHGYKGATMRAIGCQAGADPTLIRHFFGNKDGLFAAAMQLPAGAAETLLRVFDEPQDTWGSRLTGAYLSLWEDPDTAAPLRAVLVSAFTNEQALEQFRALLIATMNTAAIHRLPGENPTLRLTLAMSHLIGVALARYIMKAPALGAESVEALVALVGPIVQQYLTGAFPEHSAIDVNAPRR